MDYSILQNRNEDFEMMFNRLMYQKHTITVGIIESFDIATQTCTVLPGIRMRYQTPDGTYAYMNLPKLVGVPFVFPNGGNFSITLPIKSGDRCTLLISDRALDNFKETGKVSNPEEGFSSRSHSLTDAIATFGLFPMNSSLKEYKEDAISIRADKNGVKTVYIDTSVEDINLAVPEAKIRLSEKKLIITSGEVVFTLDGEKNKVTIISGSVEVAAENELKLSGEVISISAGSSLNLTTGMSGAEPSQGAVSAIIMDENGFTAGRTVRSEIGEGNPSIETLQNKITIGEDNLILRASSAVLPSDANSISLTLTSESAILSASAPQPEGEQPVNALFPTITLNQETISVSSAASDQNSGVILGLSNENLSITSGDQSVSFTLGNDGVDIDAEVTIGGGEEKTTVTISDGTVTAGDDVIVPGTGLIQEPTGLKTHKHGYKEPADDLGLPAMTAEPNNEVLP